MNEKAHVDKCILVETTGRSIWGWQTNTSPLAAPCANSVSAFALRHLVGQPLEEHSNDETAPAGDGNDSEIPVMGKASSRMDATDGSVHYRSIGTDA